MFKEILKIIPKIDNADLNAMERNLTRRFGNIAKKFGKGLVGALAGGGIAGLALGLIDKLLNPLKETQEAIDKVLKSGDDVVTNAKQFGTTAGKLFKLQALGKTNGLDPESLNVLLTKFQGAVAEAKADPLKKTSVRAFANDKDIAESFFQFIQQLQKMDKTQQVLVQQEVFGEKQILKMSDFLNADFAKQSKFLNRPAEELTPGLENLARQNDLKDAFAARRELEDTLKKSSLIKDDFVKRQNDAAQLDLDKENKRIASYESLATISEASNKMLGLIEQGLLSLTTLIDKLTGLTNIVKNFNGSRLLKGLFGGKDN